MDRICTGCQKRKLVDDFNFKNNKGTKRQSRCKECTRLQVRNHYYNNKDYYLKKAKLRNRGIRDEIRKYIWDYLSSHPCVDCGEKDILVLTFDHIASKKTNIADMTHWRYSKETVKREITKCLVRCANCHMKKTAKQFKWKKFASIA